MDIPKIHSISKKILVALLGGFLLIFLLFHMCANLCVLRNDGGEWYSAFCHFMGTNYIVKVFEIILLGFLGLHILMTLWLWFTNRLARPVRYHQPSKSKTSTGSKIMIISGTLMLLCIGLHFYDFFLTKFGLKNSVSQYMVKTEDLHANEAMQLSNYAAQYGMTPEEFLNFYKEQVNSMGEEMPMDQRQMVEEEIMKLEQNVAVANFMASAGDRISEDGKWIKQITPEEKKVLKAADAELDIEPDFYNMAHNLFNKPVISILYLLFFLIVGFHIRHAFESAFQTLGLNNYKYARIIEVLGIIYAWIICIGFAIVPIGVMLLF